MEVVTWSPRMTAERAAEHGAAFVPLDELLATSRVVSLHLVVLPATRHLINAERLALMQPGSLLVNTSRSELIDTLALVRALQQGRPGHRTAAHGGPAAKLAQCAAYAAPRFCDRGCVSAVCGRGD